MALHARSGGDVDGNRAGMVSAVVVQTGATMDPVLHRHANLPIPIGNQTTDLVTLVRRP
jgi:hypothetical protein